jgi:hypothetical protein
MTMVASPSARTSSSCQLLLLLSLLCCRAEAVSEVMGTVVAYEWTPGTGAVACVDSGESAARYEVDGEESEPVMVR